MPSFNVDSFIKVYDVHRANLEVGYNIYHTRLQLGTNSVVPITTAHQTTDPHLWSGSRARTTAVVAVHDRSLLYTANDVSLVGFNPIPEATDKPADYLDLPRFMLDGYVVNPHVVDRDIPGAFAFDVRIERPELAPYHVTDVRCWVNREKHRFDEADITGLVDRAIVAVSGRFCGWSNRDNLVMLDVHDMCFNPDGDVPEDTLGVSLRFWERANWADGLANFHGVRVPPPPATGYTISVLAKPSLRAPGTHPHGMPMPQGWTPPYGGPTRHVQLARTPPAEHARNDTDASASDAAAEEATAPTPAPASSEDDAGHALAVPRPRAPTPRGALEVQSAADVEPGRFRFKIPALVNRPVARAPSRDDTPPAVGTSRSVGVAASRDDGNSLTPSPSSSVVAEPPTPARAPDGSDSADVNMNDVDNVPASVVEADIVMDDPDDYFPYRACKRKRPTRGHRASAANVDPALSTIA